MADTGIARGTGAQVAYAGEKGKAAAVGAQIAYAGAKGRAGAVGLLVAYAEFKPKAGATGLQVAYAGSKGRAAAYGFMVAYSEDYRYFVIDDAVIGDQGGVSLVVTSVFDAGKTYEISLSDGTTEYGCYSGVIGQGSDVYTDGLTVAFVSPPVPPGVYSLVIYNVTDELTATIPAAIEVVRRSFHTSLFALRALIPYPRDVGARSLDDEDME